MANSNESWNNQEYYYFLVSLGVWWEMRSRIDVESPMRRAVEENTLKFDRFGDGEEKLRIVSFVLIMDENEL